MTTTTRHKTGSPALALLGVNLMVLMATLDMSIVNVSLPTLAQEMSTSFATIQWVVQAYVLVITCIMLTASRLGDMLGKRRIFIGGLVVFTLSSLCCGLSSGVWWLVSFRAVQAVGAAMCQALGVAIVADVVPSDRLGRAIGMIGGTVSLGLAAGPSVGGILIGLAGWRSVFLVNVPLGVAALWVVIRGVPALPPLERGQRFDYTGAGLLCVALLGYSLGMIQGQQYGFDHIHVLALLAGGGAVFMAFLLVEARTRQPMLDLRLFKNALFSLNLATAVMLFSGLGSILVLPFFFEHAQGRPPHETGLLLMVVPLSMGLMAPLAGTFADRWGPRGITLVGLALVCLGALALSTMTQASPWWGYALRALPFGLGLGLFQAPNNTAVMQEAPPERRGVASGLLNYSRTFGQTTGIPLMGSIYGAAVAGLTGIEAARDVTIAPAWALAQALGPVYRTVAGLAAGGLVLALVAFRIAKSRQSAQQSAQQSGKPRRHAP